MAAAIIKGKRDETILFLLPLDSNFNMTYHVHYLYMFYEHEAITNNEVAKAADIPTQNVVVRFSER